MIPIRDVNPRHRFPVATALIIAVNVLVFVFQLSLGGRESTLFVNTWGLVPRRLSSLDPNAVPTLVTSMFLHAGIAHIAGNMLYLWIFGDNIELALGSIRFVFFYILCGLGAAFGQVLVDPGSRLPMVGASGAISGVLGAYLLLFPDAQIETLVIFGWFLRLVQVPALVVLSLWIAMQLLNGLLALGFAVSGGTAWFAHVGGFVAGLALVRLFRPKRRWA